MSHFHANHNILLWLSLGILFIGPCLDFFIKNKAAFKQFIDGFTLIVLLDLIFLHILPHTLHESGWFTLVLFFLAMILPGQIEKHSQKKFAHQAHNITLGLALIGIVLHAFTDGLGLIDTNAIHGELKGSSWLPFAILLHRLPIALAIWWLVSEQVNKRMALITLIGISLATLLGYYSGINFLLPLMEQESFGLLEALIAGFLMHILFHTHDPQEHAQKSHFKTSGLGALTGLIVLIIFYNLPQSHAGHTDSVHLFIELAMISAPALVFAYLASGLLQIIIPEIGIKWLKKGGNFQQAIKGMTFGLPLPICSCGVVPLYRTLAKQGAPLAALIAFFIATPEIGLDAIFLSVPLLGKKMAILRVVSAAFVALLAGYLVSIFVKDQHMTPLEADEEKKELTLKEKIKKGFETGFYDSVDHTGPWILFGLIIATLAQPILTGSSVLKDIDPNLQVPLFALIGMPVYVCAAGITPFVAVLIAAGISPGAAIAFLLTGPATNITTFGVLKDLHGKKMVVVFTLSVVGLALICGWLVNGFVAPSEIQTGAFQHSHEHSESGYRFYFLIALAIIYSWSVLRKGPRFLIKQVISFESSSHKDHGCHEKPVKKSCCDSH